MIGIGIGAVALLLLLLQLAEMYLQLIRQQEIMAAMEPEVSIRWIKRPGKYRQIPADWDRIAADTAIPKGEHG